MSCCLSSPFISFGLESFIGEHASLARRLLTWILAFSVQEEDAPSSPLARDRYNAISSFVDDDKKTHLSFEWSFEIAKDW